MMYVIQTLKQGKGPESIFEMCRSIFSPDKLDFPNSQSLNIMTFKIQPINKKIFKAKIN